MTEFKLDWNEVPIKNCSTYNYQIIQLILMWGEKIESSVQENDNLWLANRLKFSEKDKANTSKLNKKTGELEFRKNILIDQIEVYL